MSFYENYNNEFPFYHKILHKNNSTTIISIDDINKFQHKIRINSPTTLKAIKLLGYNISELEYLSFKEYIKKNPNMIGLSKQMQQSYYESIEKLRIDRFNKIRVLRLQLKSEKHTLNSRRSQSSYNIKRFSSNKKYEMPNRIIGGGDSFGHTAIENEKKILERMRNKNETEIINKIQFELKKELVRKKYEKKIEEHNKKLKMYEKELNKKRKEE